MLVRLRRQPSPALRSRTMYRTPPAPRWGAAADGRLPPAARGLLDTACSLGLLDPDALRVFVDAHGDRLADGVTAARAGRVLVQAGLLTSYQVDRLLGGAAHGLLLGGYRVLEELGGGGMGRVYLAEHALLKRRVAVKVLPVDDDCPPALRQRFYAEMRLLADLHHPNVVQAYDAGEVPPPG